MKNLKNNQFLAKNDIGRIEKNHQFQPNFEEIVNFEQNKCVVRVCHVGMSFGCVLWVCCAGVSCGCAVRVCHAGES